jgi:hypothetical protein
MRQAFSGNIAIDLVDSLTDSTVVKLALSDLLHRIGDILSAPSVGFMSRASVLLPVLIPKTSDPVWAVGITGKTGHFGSRTQRVLVTKVVTS